MNAVYHTRHLLGFHFWQDLSCFTVQLFNVFCGTAVLTPGRQLAVILAIAVSQVRTEEVRM